MNYQEVYHKLIEKARNENRVKNGDVYHEAHHIIPSCLGGDGKCSQWRYHPNIVLLTAKEHFLAHRLLYFLNPQNPKLVYAYWAMCTLTENGRDYKISAREYSRIREDYSKFKSEELKGTMTGELNPFFGKKHDPAWIEQHARYLSENFSGSNSPNFGKKRTLDSKAKQGQTRKEKNLPSSMKGKTHKEESKKLMSEKKQGVYDGKKNPMFAKNHKSDTILKLREKALARKKVTCEHCGKVCSVSSFSVHHGPMCTTKLKKDDIKNRMLVNEYSKKWHKGTNWGSYYLYKKELLTVIP
jgi:hypothetical protein